MKLSDKIVITFPLEEIWHERGSQVFKRKSYLTKDSLKSILQKNETRFVVADVGEKLLWIDSQQSFKFWKEEVKEHIADDLSYIALENYPDEYAYIASEWIGENTESIILLEKMH